jgi:GTP-binding protein HflX
MPTELLMTNNSENIDSSAENVIKTDIEELSVIEALKTEDNTNTLEEINNSALIIHVVDSSSPHCKDQIDVTNKVLEEIGVKNSKELYLLNKADKGVDEHFFINKDHLKFSNKNGLNHDKLITLIQESVLDYSNTLLDLNIPISDGKAISIVEGYGIIEAKFISNEYIYYKAYIPNNLINNLKQYYYFKTNNPKPF